MAKKVKVKKEGGFREAFAAAKKAGKKTFTWNGKSYDTGTADEKAKKNNVVDNAYETAIARTNEASARKKGQKSKAKSYKEIGDSYKKQLVKVHKKKGIQ